MRDGLYKVEFQTKLGMGAGVVHMLGGKIWGGDSALYYIGTYRLEGNRFTASVSTNRHASDPSIRSVFGVDRVTISLEGVTDGDTGVMTGKAAEAPGVTFQARLVRISD